MILKTILVLYLIKVDIITIFNYYIKIQSSFGGIGRHSRLKIYTLSVQVR